MDARPPPDRRELPPGSMKNLPRSFIVNAVVMAYAVPVSKAIIEPLLRREFLMNSDTL